MALHKCAIAVALLSHGSEASYPTQCNAYTTCAHLQGDCCPNNMGVNLACCFSGALQMDADTASAEAKRVSDEADKETAQAEAAAAKAQAAVDDAKRTKEAADARAKKIQKEIDRLNKNSDAAQKKAQQAAAEATNDATAAAKQALAAEAAATHAKKVEDEQKKIVAETSDAATKAKAAAEAAKAKADKLNEIAGAATKKLNDEKKHQEEVAAAAEIKEEANEKIVEANNKEAAKIKAAADKKVQEANEKKAAAEGMISKINNAQCKKHEACKHLDGYCCPTIDFSTTHLGSTKLNGPVLGCCGTATELNIETPTELAAVGDHSTQSDGFGASAMLLSALCGSALTMAALRISKRKEEQGASYQTM